MGRILVVDDDPGIVALLRELLASDGHQVSVASTAEMAIELSKEDETDLIMIDIRLPGMQGDELVEYFKIHQQGCPMIVMTSFPSVESAVDSFKLGVFDFLVKPFPDNEAVRMTVERAIETFRVRKLARKAPKETETHLTNIVDTDKTKEILASIVMENLAVPIGNIRSMLDLMLSDSEKNMDPETKRSFEEIQAETESAYRIIKRLSNIMMMDKSQLYLDFTLGSLEDIIYDVIKEFGKGKLHGKDISPEIDPSVPVIEMDVELITDVLHNLLSNAARFSPFNDLITISTSYLRKTGEVMVSVADNGPGIPLALQKKVFEKFGQADLLKAGLKIETGLGLPFCKLAVEAHKGRIWIDEKRKIGNRIIFTLPLNQKNWSRT